MASGSFTHPSNPKLRRDFSPDYGYAPPGDNLVVCRAGELRRDDDTYTRATAQCACA